ncbi:hypothetical protein COO60DRAFT_1151482 [Scenedesmus sp. NREL 46B-D3]|nr:hypothetical protein COO60DRAFT_1151482 [Scenedesmus sp. NREL 46B-D3]
MQTRTRCRAAALSGTSSALPALPGAAHMLILDRLVTAYPEPDTVDYALYPFKSTLGWMLSMRLVNKQCWPIPSSLDAVANIRSQHIQQHVTVAARCRLESLRNLSLLHVYAHLIVTARTYKVKRRNRKVPKKVTLNFADIDNSSCHFTVPRALSKAESAGGLPSHTLMLVACYDQLTLPALQQLLADLDCLDQQHAAPMVLKLLTTRSLPAAPAAAAAAAAAAAGRTILPNRPPGGGSCSLAAVQDSSRAAISGSLTPPLPHPTAAGAAAVAHPPSCSAAAGSVNELIATVAPLLQQRLVHVVMEGSAASPALYFIPTKQGFCRRVPAVAAVPQTCNVADAVGV